MLAGMNQERFDALLPVHGSQQGSNLNQVGSCAYDVDDFHLNCRLSYQRKNTLPCMAKGSERRYASLRPTAPNCLPRTPYRASSGSSRRVSVQQALHIKASS